ncbi:MAG TPA: hypothetical protein VEY90_09535 [Thermoleophilaceae bacterium]|nr:hypothetical protein [Thermoleophilaceae bacterium]
MRSVPNTSALASADSTNTNLLQRQHLAAERLVPRICAPATSAAEPAAASASPRRSP